MKKILLSLVCILFALLFAGEALGQNATINVQGILRKISGVPVDDGPHDVKFRLFDVLSGGTKLWEEAQTVDVSSGIYSAVLGDTTTFASQNLKFDKQYYLEVEIGGKPLLPRVPLTPAPYALSLLGDPNKFPSSGAVQADGIVVGENLTADDLALSPDHSAVVKGGVLASSGAPGQDGENNKGYAFINDGETGLFSTAKDKVALYTDNQERLVVTNTQSDVKTDLNVAPGKKIQSGGVSQWRLIDVNDFSDGTSQGWGGFKTQKANGPDDNVGTKVRDITSSSGDGSAYYGSVLTHNYNSGADGRTEENETRSIVLRKQLQLSSYPHDYVKVKFDYYFYGSLTCEAAQDECQGYGGFLIGTQITDAKQVLLWQRGAGLYPAWDLVLDDEDDSVKIDNSGNHGNIWCYRGLEMTIKNSDNDIYIVFKGNSNQGSEDEGFAIGNIEIWVR